MNYSRMEKSRDKAGIHSNNKTFIYFSEFKSNIKILFNKELFFITVCVRKEDLFICLLEHGKIPVFYFNVLVYV